MLVCNSWHYITCPQQSNSCDIVKVLFHMGEQSVELHSLEGGFVGGSIETAGPGCMTETTL